MRKLKIAFIALLTITVIFAVTAVWCYLRVTVYAPKPYLEDGVWHDPPLSAYKALRPYQTFLRYSPISLSILFALWIAIGIVWKRQKRSPIVL